MKVILVAALSSDGFIARAASHGADWTGTADKKIFVKLTKAMGIMVMGSTTFATIGRALPGRRTIVYTSNPQSITAEGVETTTEPPLDLINRLEQRGATGVAICGGAQIYTQFMQAGLIQDFYLTHVPVVFGEGITLFSSPLDVHLDLVTSEPIGEGAVLMHYRLKSLSS
nr:Dihydrofolate reductase [uncultured bacterium]